MDLFQAMRIFSAVAAEGSMTAGGRRLGLSKALVSRTISDLEDRLKLRLLNRTTRRLALTEAGAVYLDHCREMLERNDEVECRLAEVSQQATGTLRVNAPINYGTSILAPLLPAFLARHEALSIELELTDRFVDMVEEGVDLVIRIGHTLPETAIARKIGETRHHLVAAPSLVSAHGVPKRSEDLADWPRLVYPQRLEPEAREGGKRRDVVRTNGGDALAALAEAGIGYAYLPEFLIRDALDDGRLVKLMEGRADETTPIHALWPHRKHLSFKTRVFLDYLIAALK